MNLLINNALISGTGVDSINFITNKNGTFNPTVSTSAGTATWMVEGETTQISNTPSFTLDGTDRNVRLVIGDFDNITAINLSSQNIKGTINLTLLTSCVLFNLSTNSELTGVTNPTSSAVITNYVIGSTAITSLDLSVFSNLGGVVNGALCSSLTTLTVGSSTQTITAFDFTDADITGDLDLSGYTGLSNDFRLHLNANLTDVVFPTTSNNFIRIWVYGTSVGVLNWAALSGVITDILLLNNAWTSAESDENLVLIDNNINITNSTINIAGTNGILTDGTGTGFDGLTAKSNLETAGNTVTANT